ncbi:MAG: metal-sensitive transcriptional regulator [Anaerolineae bacterium]
MPDVDKKTPLLNRARSIQGHMGAVVRMLEEDAYCVDIIKQTQAVQKAIDRLNALILEKHLNHCVTTAIRSRKPEERERVIAELLDVFETANKGRG